MKCLNPISKSPEWVDCEIITELTNDLYEIKIQNIGSEFNKVKIVSSSQFGKSNNFYAIQNKSGLFWGSNCYWGDMPKLYPTKELAEAIISLREKTYEFFEEDIPRGNIKLVEVYIGKNS